MAKAEQLAWVQNVFGLALTGSTAPDGATAPYEDLLHTEATPEGDFQAEWPKSFSAWRNAVETVDQQMGALGAACRQSEDPWLARIADLGLPAVTANFKTPLMTACLEVSAAPADKVAGPAAKARAAVANFAKHIASDPQVAGCDSNPFGVSVSIRGTLGPALKSLNDTLRLAR